MPKIVCVLYDDPIDGYAKSYSRDDLPTLTNYPDGQTLPSPKAIDFNCRLRNRARFVRDTWASASGD